MADIRLKCSNCSKGLKVPDKYAGRVVACPACKQKLRIPEPIMEATLLEDDELPAPRPRRRSTSAKRKPAAEEQKMTPAEWVAAALLFLAGPFVAVVWAMRGNAKWKPVLALSLGLYAVGGGVLYWQWDNLVEFYAWEGQEHFITNDDNTVTLDGMVSGDSTYRDPSIDDDDGDEGGATDAQIAEAQRQFQAEIKRRQEAAEAMMAPPPESDLVQMDPIRQRAYRANVRIDVEGFGLGSGIVCEMPGETAMILTNRHVIDPEFEYSSAPTVDPKNLPMVEVTYVDGSKKPGEVIWVANDRVDLAVVRAICPASGVEVADWRETPRIRVGERVFAVGNPVGLGWTLTQGSVSALRQRKLSKRNVPVVQIDATINQGNSGGGLYNESGQLIGINNFIIDPARAQNTGFAIRAEILKELKPKGLQFAAE